MPSPSPTAFIVLARIRVKAGCVDDYISMSKATDDLVQQNESGTAHHVFVSDPNDPLLFTWAEAFVNDESFLEHLNARTVGSIAPTDGSKLRVYDSG